MVYHFRKRWNIEEDLYAISIDKNVQYINFVLKNDEMEYRQRFRRGGLTQKLEHMN